MCSVSLGGKRRNTGILRSSGAFLPTSRIQGHLLTDPSAAFRSYPRAPGPFLRTLRYRASSPVSKAFVYF